MGVDTGNIKGVGRHDFTTKLCWL